MTLGVGVRMDGEALTAGGVEGKHLPQTQNKKKSLTLNILFSIGNKSSKSPLTEGQFLSLLCPFHVLVPG